MADKFFHEFPPTTTLKDTSILLLDQDNQTYQITLSSLKSFLGTGTGSSGTNYTTVGNASAGIFVAAKCFSSGTGTWTAPAGCYTARVTLIGGGSTYVYQGVGTSSSGTHSTFNYSGTTITGTAQNQLIATGGTDTLTVKRGGGAGWNGVSVNGAGGSLPGSSAVVATTNAEGKCAAMGFGGGGGRGYNTNNTLSNIVNGQTLGRNGLFIISFFNAINSNNISILPTAIGASGGILGNANTYIGGGGPMFSAVATKTNNFSSLINTCGTGSNGGCGGGWCMAIVNVTPNTSYSYKVGGGGAGAGGGMVLIEW